jgi:hypothetical protein
MNLSSDLLYDVNNNPEESYSKLAFTRGFARKFQNVLKLCF